MPNTRSEPSQIKNKAKREEVARKLKRNKAQTKLQKRLAQAKSEAQNPAAKKKRQAENVPRTLDNTREFYPSFLTANPSASAPPPAEPQEKHAASTSYNPQEQPQDENAANIASDPFADYFSGTADPTTPPKVLITTSQKATRATYGFCEELVDVFPGAEVIRRKKGQGFEMGRIAGWATDRGYSHLLVVNEDTKKPNAMTLVYLPNGPTAYFKLTSIEPSKKISGHARSTDHCPELVLNGFVTRLGHTVGRLFQTLFPPMPEFQGRQVVTLHNQRDFLFFRRHRYAFRSTEKVSLQEIGPRFTLKLRSLRKGLPAVKNIGEEAKDLKVDTLETTEPDQEAEPIAPLKDDHPSLDTDDAQMTPERPTEKALPPQSDEYLWMWKPDLETTRRTFFL